MEGSIKKYINRQTGMYMVRGLLALVFLASGIGKLLDSSAAQSVIEFYFVTGFIRTYAYEIIKAISVLEVVLGLLLIWGRYVVTTLSASLVLVGAFTGLLMYLYITGVDLSDCGCFGLLEIKSSIEFTILKNLVLSGIIIGGFFLIRGRKQAYS